MDVNVLRNYATRNAREKKSTISRGRDVTVQQQRHFFRHTTIKFNLRYLASHYCLIIVKCRIKVLHILGMYLQIILHAQSIIRTK